MAKYTFTSLSAASLLLITYGFVYSSVVNIGVMVDVGEFLFVFDTSRHRFLGHLVLLMVSLVTYHLSLIDLLFST